MEFIIALMIVAQIIGIFYWAVTFIDFKSWRNITIGNLIMIIISPIGLIIGLLIEVMAYIVDNIQPIWNKRLFKRKRRDWEWED